MQEAWSYAAELYVLIPQNYSSLTLVSTAGSQSIIENE